MCGRFTLVTEPEQLALRFNAALPRELPLPHYNAAPTQELPLILNQDERRIELMRWGLIPHWAKDSAIGSRLINARAETVEEKPSFRDAFHKRRCLVLADGFYEWQKTPEGKAPLRLMLKSGEPFAFAGLWDTWKNPSGPPLRTFTILTTAANELIAPIHERMPVILLPEQEDVWLDQEAGRGAWREVLQPYSATLMTAYRVSARVNSPINDDPALLAAV